MKIVFKIIFVIAMGSLFFGTLMRAGVMPCFIFGLTPSAYLRFTNTALLIIIALWVMKKEMKG